MATNYRRVNILIREDQHEEVVRRGLSISGLVRDLLDDRFSDTKIILSLTRDAKKLYDHIISNFGASDLELEEYLVDALDKFLIKKTKEIEKLRDTLKRSSGKS